MEFDKDNYVKTVYDEIFNELKADDIFKTSKQEDRWWELVNQSLLHTEDMLNRVKYSHIVTGIEIIASGCCKECKEYDGKVYKNGDSMPILPIAKCNSLRSGNCCTCCYAPVTN